jgi:hypothetical protein
MSEDPPRYSIYAAVAPDQAEACFVWLSENMTQCTSVEFTSHAIWEPSERKDIVTKGFKNEVETPREATSVASA